MNAVVARSLAQATGSRLAEEAFLSGLLADIGKLVLARHVRDVYEPLVAAAGGWPDPEMERAVLGYDSFDVGAALLDRWGVPPLFGAAVRHGARFVDPPGEAGKETTELTRLLRLALRAASVFFDDDKGSAMLLFTRESQELFGFAEQDVDTLMARVEEGVAQTAEVFEVRIPAGLSYQGILDAARMQMLALSLDATADLHQEQARADELEHRVMTDALTGLPNREAFDEFLHRQLQARLRGGVARCLGIVMIDIDHFKAVNDRYGHAAGDTVLRTLGVLLKTLTRTNELIARFGGEEFVLVAPAAEPEELARAGERLRLAVERTPVELGDGRILSVTASFGGAAVRRPADLDAGAALLERADQALYRAKVGGRNRVEVDDTDEQ